MTGPNPGAPIHVDSVLSGKGHCEVDLARDRAHVFMSTESGQVGVLDIIGGVLFGFPFIGCFTPGFWELRQTNVTIAVAVARPTTQP